MQQQQLSNALSINDPAAQCSLPDQSSASGAASFRQVQQDQQQLLGGGRQTDISLRPHPRLECDSSSLDQTHGNDVLTDQWLNSLQESTRPGSNGIADLALALLQQSACSRPEDEGCPSQQQNRPLLHLRSTRGQHAAPAGIHQATSASQTDAWPFAQQHVHNEPEALKHMAQDFQSAPADASQQDAMLQRLTSAAPATATQQEPVLQRLLAAASAAGMQSAGSPQLSTQPSAQQDLILQQVRRTASQMFPNNQQRLLLDQLLNLDDHLQHQPSHPDPDQHPPSHLKDRMPSAVFADLVSQGSEASLEPQQERPHADRQSVAENRVVATAALRPSQSGNELQDMAQSLQKLLQLDAASQTEADADDQTRPSGSLPEAMDDHVHEQGQRSAEAQGEASTSLQSSDRDLQPAASSRSLASHAMHQQPESMKELLQQLGRLVEGIRQPTALEEAEATSLQQPQSTQNIISAADGAALQGVSAPCAASQRSEPACNGAVGHIKAETSVFAAENSDPAARQAVSPSVSSFFNPPQKTATCHHIKSPIVSRLVMSSVRPLGA